MNDVKGFVIETPTGHLYVRAYRGAGEIEIKTRSPPPKIPRLRRAAAQQMSEDIGATACIPLSAAIDLMDSLGAAILFTASTDEVRREIASRLLDGLA